MPRPSQSHLVNRLRHLSLSSPPTTALFFARLWYSLCPPTEIDHECLHVLALCLLQVKQTYSALHLARDSADGTVSWQVKGKQPAEGCSACGMIVARCCQALGRFSEGKQVLERAFSRGAPPTNLPMPCPATTAATASLLMAALSHKGKAREQAVDFYAKTLHEDPWLWEAFTGLCDIGSPPSIEQVFPDPPMLSRASSSRTSRPPTLSPNPMPRSSASEIPGLAPTRRQMSPLAGGPVNGSVDGGGFFTPDVGNVQGVPRYGMMGNPTVWDTPSINGDTTFPTIAEHGSMPPPSRRQLPNLISSFMPSASSILPASFRPGSAVTPVNNGLPAPAAPAMKRPRGGYPPKKPTETAQNGREFRTRDLRSIEPNGEVDAPVRRSSRLKSTSKPVPSKPAAREKRTTRSRSATSSASGATAEISSPPSHDSQLQVAADDWLRDIVRRCARSYRFLSLYQTQACLRELDTLPVELQSSAWTLEMVARAFYESANYIPARRAFRSLLAVDPYRLEAMEIYSTLLWHLSDPVSLSHISQHLISIDRESPQPWIAAGNCFSLQKDHDEAMRCFRRATQVDPGCAYAWTLCGYEAVEMEEYDRAVQFYRTAIRTDSRHYNAWYGMGLVYLKMGKPKYAEHHFRRAAEINPTNAVLLCCIGMVLEQSDDIVQALDFYDQACRYAPDSPMVTFKRIRMLVALSRIEEAIIALQRLSREAPDEAQVHFLLGKCYLRHNRRGEATVAFTAARELQPKLEAGIRAAMLGREDGEDDALAED